MLEQPEPTIAPNDETFRLLVESVKDYGIFLLDTAGRVTSWNKGAQRINGYSAAEIVGRHFSIFYSPDDVASGRCESELATALAEGRVEDHGWRVRKGGSRFWANVVITPLLDASGKHVGFAKVTLDLTDRAYRDFIEATNAIVWTTDANGHPNADSPSWRAFTGQTEEEWRGLRGWDPVHPDDTPALRVSWPAAKAQKKVFEAEFRMRRRDGAYVWMGTRAVPFLEPDGAVREWFGVTFDISARKRAEQERAEALEREREARLAAERAQSWWTTTLRSIGDAVIATDTDGRVTFMNAVAEELTRWSLEEARGRPLLDVFPIVNEETRRRVESPVDKVLREGVIVGLANHTVLVRRDGTDVCIDDSAAPIRDADGALLGVVLVFRDVTAEKRAETRRAYLARAGEALVAASDYREALTTVTQLAVPRLADWCAVDILEPGDGAARQLAVAHVDPSKVALARELGHRYPPDPAAETGSPNVIRTGVAELYPRIPEELLTAAAVDDEHLRLIRELALHSAMVVPLRGRERVFGAITFVYAESGREYGDDDLAFAQELARRAAVVIERRRLEEERVVLLERERQARADAEMANRAKDEFLATVSHELRTPLNAILGWTVMLRQKQVPHELDRGLAIVERNARAQARLIDDVLDISRIIGGKLRLDLGWTNVPLVITNAAESARPLAEAKQIALVTAIDPELTGIVADPERLQQVVSNLLSNAVKFTPSGGRVEIEARRHGSRLRIRVTDTGEGVDPSLLAAIFEPFRQADASTTRRHGGIGLGLAIVRQLVQAHGGTVRAESAGRDRGATFVVELPALPAAAPQHAASRAVEPSRAPSATRRLEGLRVLAVDDEAEALALVRELLEDSGATVEIADCAARALEIFPRLRPDVLVSDIGMPDVDGYALLRRIRSLAAADGGRTPALALTAYAGREDADRAFAAGFQTHLAKPVEADHLLAVIANLAGLPIDG